MARYIAVFSYNTYVRLNENIDHTQYIEQIETLDAAIAYFKMLENIYTR